MKNRDSDKSQKQIKDNKINNDNGGDQRHKARITEAQQQKDTAEHEFKDKYDEKTSKKKKRQPHTAQEEVKEPEADKPEKDPPKKVRGKKKFFAFIKGLKKRSVWNKIVLHLRNLFKTKQAILEEEILHSTKLLKLKSMLGFKSKSEEKQLTVRIAYLLQELSMLKQQTKTLAHTQQMLKSAGKLVAITEGYIKSISENKNIQRDHIKSQVTETHSTTANAIKKQQEASNTQNNTAVSLTPAKQQESTKNTQLYPYMMQSHNPVYLNNQNINNPLIAVLTLINAQASKVISSIADQAKNYMVSMVALTNHNMNILTPNSVQQTYTVGESSVNTKGTTKITINMEPSSNLTIEKEICTQVTQKSTISIH